MFERKTFLLAALAIPPTNPNIEIHGFSMVESKNHLRSIELNSKKALLYKLQNIVVLEDLGGTVWNKKRDPMQIQGKKGILDSTTQNFDIREKAQVLTPEGLIFTSEDLQYFDKERIMSTESPIDVIQKNEAEKSYLRLKGIGMKMNLDDGSYFVKQNVVAQQKLGQDRFDISSAQARLVPEQKNVSFWGGVSVKSNKMDMSGDKLLINFDRFDTVDEQHQVQEGQFRPQKMIISNLQRKDRKASKIRAHLSNMQIHSDGLEISFNAQGDIERSEALGAVNAETDDGMKMQSQKLTSVMEGQRQKVIMEGQVTILSQTKISKCEKANYFPDTGDIYLETVASVVDGGQVLEGDRIHYSTKSSEVSVDKVRGDVSSQSFSAPSPSSAPNTNSGAVTPAHQ